MATKNIVPRATGEGGIGTAVKRWLIGFFNSLDVANGTNAPVNTLQRSTAYALNDVAFYSGIDAKYFLKCTTAGTTAASVPSFSGVTSDSTVTDGTAVWTVKTLGNEELFGDYLPLSGGTMTGALTGTDATFSGDVSADDITASGDATVTGNVNAADFKVSGVSVTPPIVGEVRAYAGSTTPTGWLLCDGSAVSRTDYADLYTVIGDTYGAGDGSTTFNLPNLVDKFIQGSATSGTVKTAGLPNITGYISDVLYYSTGAGDGKSLYITNGAPAMVGAGSSRGYGNLNFDASRSSSIYGNSTTVQPPALTMLYIIKY